MMATLSITRQFMILALFGVALTVGGLGLALKRGAEAAFEAKSAEVRHVTEAGASLVRIFVERARTGAMTTEAARAEALATLGKMHFDGGNYL